MKGVPFAGSNVLFMEKMSMDPITRESSDILHFWLDIDAGSFFD